MAKGNICPYCHTEFLNARPNSHSLFRYGSILRFSSGSTLRICLNLHRVAYRYSGTDRNRDSFRKEPVFYRFVENRY